MPPEKALATSKGGSSAVKRPKTHTVRQGQTLSGIAHKHGVRTSDIKRWNNIKDARRIRPGQKLKLYGAAPGPKWTAYTVRRGDTLSGIARRHGCSTSDLKKWNSLKSTRIMAGQKLKVRK
jgi:LysM repeat protein